MEVRAQVRIAAVARGINARRRQRRRRLLPSSSSDDEQDRENELGVMDYAVLLNFPKNTPETEDWIGYKNKALTAMHSGGGRDNLACAAVIRHAQLRHPRIYSDLQSEGCLARKGGGSYGLSHRWVLPKRLLGSKVKQLQWLYRPLHVGTY